VNVIKEVPFVKLLPFSLTCFPFPYKLIEEETFLMNQILTHRWNILTLGLLFVGALWMIFSRVTDRATTNGMIPAPRQGFLAPDFNTPTLDGGQISLSDFRGRPVLINIWASWCPPCKTEMPTLESVYRAYQDQGLAILAVNTTNQDTLQAAETFVKANKLTFPILIDVDGAVSQLYQLKSLPTSFFVDRAGVIQEVIVGGPMSEALLRIRVEQLLQEPY
jgi:cytochrome c biogenesis protein CcmG/thiol:disulfide interchange protein DsbE